MDCFVKVPATKLPCGLEVPAFEIGQYACSKGLFGRAVVTAEGQPWTNLIYFEAVEACRRAGYKLIRESQWLAVSYNALQVRENRISDSTGKGRLATGIRHKNLNEAIPLRGSVHHPERWAALSTGERVCDLNGNLQQWVFDDVQGNEEGLLLMGAYATNSPSLTTDCGYSAYGRGGGLLPEGSERRAAVRGGGTCTDHSGLFFLYPMPPSRAEAYRGFRCVR